MKKKRDGVVLPSSIYQVHHDAGIEDLFLREWTCCCGAVLRNALLIIVASGKRKTRFFSCFFLRHCSRLSVTINSAMWEGTQGISIESLHFFFLFRQFFGEIESYSNSTSYWGYSEKWASLLFRSTRSAIYVCMLSATSNCRCTDWGSSLPFWSFVMIRKETTLL